jgi:hypothetical protein
MGSTTKQLSEQFKNELLFRKNDLQRTMDCLRDVQFADKIKAIIREIDMIDSTIEEIDRIDFISKQLIKNN